MHGESRSVINLNCLCQEHFSLCVLMLLDERGTQATLREVHILCCEGVFQPWTVIETQCLPALLCCFFGKVCGFIHVVEHLCSMRYTKMQDWIFHFPQLLLGKIIVNFEGFFHGVLILLRVDAI